MFQPQLSPREVEVIQLVADGLTDKEIATHLQITPRTVSEHINNIRDKLGASNRTSAVYLYFYRALGQRKQHAPAAAPAQQEHTMTSKTEYTLRPPVPEKDIADLVPTAFQIHASTWFGSDSFLEATSEASMADAFAQGMSDPKHRWRVAQDAQGTVLGHSQLYQEPWSTGTSYVLNITVKTDKRNRGVGSALYDDALAHSRQNGAQRLNTLAAEHNRAALRFAFKRGFVQMTQHLAFELDLTRFDASRFDGLTDFVGQSGVRITSVAEFGDSEDARRKLFQVNAWSAALDLPGVKDEPAWDSFEQFNEAVCASSWYQPEGQIVAIDTQTNEWMGMAATTVNANGASNLHTGIDRRYRHNPLIGQALKLASIQYAKRKGATRLRDDCISRDATNLAINYMMGYEIKAGIVYLERTL